MKATMTALIVDDERLSRKELALMLAGNPRLKVIGEAEDVPSAIVNIKELNPDLIFLDIQMPGQTGFDLLEQIDYEGRIIFVTAYDEYAIRAFEVNALDYLLKPVSPERLEKSVSRLFEDAEPAVEPKKVLNWNDRLFILFGNQMRFLKISTIVCIIAEGDYSKVYTTDQQPGLVLKSMQEWEERLPESYFCRIHRSAIINMDFADRLEKWFNYSYQVHLKGYPEPLVISRRYAKKIKDRMG